MPHLLINIAKWNELPKSYQAHRARRRPGSQRLDDGEVRRAQSAGRQTPGRGGAELRPFPQPVMEACYKAANELYAEISQTNPMFKKLYDSLIAFRNDAVSVAAGRGTIPRQFHDPRMRTRA